MNVNKLEDCEAFKNAFELNGETARDELDAEFKLICNAFSNIVSLYPCRRVV